MSSHEFAKRLDELEPLDISELIEHRLRYKQYMADLDASITNLTAEGRDPHAMRAARFRYQSALGMINDLLTLKKHGGRNAAINELYEAARGLVELEDDEEPERYESCWTRLEQAVEDAAQYLGAPAPVNMKEYQ